MKDNSDFWHYYRTQTAHFDFCTILFFRTLVIAFTVLTAILGAVVVGLALVLHGGNEYTPDVLEDYATSISNITTAMIVLGGIIICMSIMGCLATVFENTWFTVGFVMILILSMAGQLSCGVLTLFLREEVRTWATDGQNNKNCTTCFDAFETSFEYPTVLAVLLLAALGVQLAIIASACKASRMRTEAKRALLLAEFVPSQEICEREARKYCDTKCKNKAKEEVEYGFEKDKDPDNKPVTEPWSAKSSRPRSSPSPTKVHKQQTTTRESVSGYERIEEENAVEVHSS